ncbi:hypothetical protein, partial [Bacillus sp. 'calajunan']|uniref:hypothetical protein n=1 Tax=Bacillus sp. 'calajunan' TaxID=3447457 RepID=UPI003EDFFA04
GAASQVAGNAIGGDVGRAVSTIGGAAAPLIPYQAGPQLAPMGLFGNIVGAASQVAGNAIGGDVGRAVSTIGGAAAPLIPYQAGPQLAPMGLFGNNIVCAPSQVAGW